MQRDSTISHPIFPKAVVSKFRRAIDRHGLYGTVRVGCGKLLAVARNFRPSARAEAQEREQRAAEFDRQFGVDTTGFIHPTELQITHPHQRYAVSYRGSDPKYFQDAIARLGIDYRRFVFIDFGSGKGRALLLAAAFPFKRIIGIEFSPELHRVAQQNIDQFCKRTGCTIELQSVCMDATAFNLPPDPLICYFFNPFSGEVMRHVVNNIRFSLSTVARDVFIVYYNPREGQVFDSADFLDRVSDVGPIRIWHARN